jgi:hypothetical protein
MSNPTGDALVAIGIRDTQRIDSEAIATALHSNTSDTQHRKREIKARVMPFVATGDTTLAPSKPLLVCEVSAAGG